MASSWSICWSATTSIRKSASCGETTYGAATLPRASVPDRVRCAPSASTRGPGRSRTSRTWGGVWTTGTPASTSASNSRAAIASGSLRVADSSSFPAPFRLSERVTVPAGAYDFDLTKISYNVGQQRKLSGNISLERGAFYGGRRTTLGISRGRVNVTSRLSAEPFYTVNWIDIPQEAFTTHLLGSRVTYSISPLIFGSALAQYNSSTRTVALNVRLRWEYQPGSELIVVYNEQRDTLGRPSVDGTSRALIIKINRLFRS